MDKTKTKDLFRESFFHKRGELRGYSAPHLCIIKGRIFFQDMQILTLIIKGGKSVNAYTGRKNRTFRFLTNRPARAMVLC